MQRVNPSKKIVQTMKNFGQANVNKQQGTTRIIYDTLELTANTDIYRFFENVNSRIFPLTNMQNGNKLEAGEVFTLLYGWLMIMVVKLDAETGDPIEYQLIDLSGGSVSHKFVDLAGDPITAPWTATAVERYVRAASKIALGEFQFQCGNTTILKPISLTAFHPSFNKSAKNESNGVFAFDSVLTIPPMVEFIGQVRIIPLIPTDFAPNTKVYLRLTLEGLGGILAPRQTF